MLVKFQISRDPIWRIEKITPTLEIISSRERLAEIFDK